LELVKAALLSAVGEKHSRAFEFLFEDQGNSHLDLQCTALLFIFDTASL